MDGLFKNTAELIRTFCFVLCVCVCVFFLLVQNRFNDIRFFFFCEMPSVYMLRFLLCILCHPSDNIVTSHNSAWHFSVVNWPNCIICEMCRSFFLIFFLTKVPSWPRLFLFPVKLTSGINFVWRERREQSLWTKVIQHWELTKTSYNKELFIDATQKILNR